MNTPTLYELSAQYRMIEDLDLDEETLFNTLEAIDGALTVKAENIAMTCRELDATADAIDDAISKMTDRKKAIEARSKRVKTYIKDAMTGAGISKIEGPHLRLSIQNNPPAVVVENVDSIPPSFFYIPAPPPPAPDKKKISEALKAGQSIPGAWLKQDTRLVIK